MIEYAVEPWMQVVEEIKLIVHEHWEELALDKDQIKLDPDYNRYESIDALGVIHLVTARDNGILIGYCIFFVMPALHYKNSKQAVYDIFYLRKPYRKGRNGIRFIKFAEESLKKVGVQKVYMGVKLNNDFGKVFEYLGFTPAERIYIKMIG